MASIERLLEIMARLRDPEGGCPWDLEQDFESIAPYTIEEAYEVEDAIRRRQWDELRGELGDLLLQVVYHAQLAREAGHFDFDGVVDGICAKMIERHPHVFGEVEIASARAQVDSWDAIKERERRERARRSGRAPSAADDVPRALPSLLRGAKLLRRARRAGHAREPDAGLAAALALALPDPGDAGRLGDLLLAAAERAAGSDVDPEAACRAACDRLEAHIRGAES